MPSSPHEFFKVFLQKVRICVTFHLLKFILCNRPVSKGERSGDESSESVDSDEEADGSGSEHNEPEIKNTRGWSKLILQ